MTNERVVPSDNVPASMNGWLSGRRMCTLTATLSQLRSSLLFTRVSFEIKSAE